MKKLNRKLEYSLMALKHMSQKVPGELTTAKEVSESYRTPFDVTARVMQIMANRGILRSEQGVSGGYQITKDLSKVSMLDLMDIIEGPAPIAKCLHKKDPCEIQKSCNIISPIQSFNQKLNDFYKNLSVGDLLLRSPRGSL